MAKQRWIVKTPAERTDRDGRQADPFWARLGTAFQNDNGTISVQLDGLPVNGRLVLFEPDEDDDKGRGRRDDSRNDSRDDCGRDDGRRRR